MRTDGPVLIALDGAPRSDRTLEWGLREAERRGASVVLTRVAHDPREFAAGGWFPTLGNDDLDGQAKEYLDAVLDREARRRPMMTITSALLQGSVVPELRTQSDDAQLLVLGPGSQRRPGHVATHLAAHARCPVAVVRDRGESAPGAASGVVRPVVVGVDGSPSSLLAAATAAAAAVARGARLRLVHARAMSPFPFPHDTDLVPEHRAVEELSAQLSDEHEGLVAEPLVVDGDPAHAIVRVASNAQLVVVGSRGLGAFRGMLLGSVSHEVLREAQCTVLVERR